MNNENSDLSSMIKGISATKDDSRAEKILAIPDSKGKLMGILSTFSVNGETIPEMYARMADAAYVIGIIGAPKDAVSLGNKLMGEINYGRHLAQEIALLNARIFYDRGNKELVANLETRLAEKNGLDTLTATMLEAMLKLGAHFRIAAIISHELKSPTLAPTSEKEYLHAILGTVTRLMGERNMSEKTTQIAISRMKTAQAKGGPSMAGKPKTILLPIIR